MVALYGIRNCDTMKKALRWLDERGIDYRFHDFGKSGLDPALLEAWEQALGWEALLNRRGMQWRRVPQAARAGIDRPDALRLMLEAPSMIRRPVLDTGTALHVGFSPARYAEIFRGAA